MLNIFADAFSIATRQSGWDRATPASAEARLARARGAERDTARAGAGAANPLRNVRGVGLDLAPSDRR